jgi:hypothetical protein
MFNPKEFEQKVYALVTQEVNKAFSKILNSDKEAVQQKGVKVHRQVMKALHLVTEETAIQILHGLLAYK